MMLLTYDIQFINDTIEFFQDLYLMWKAILIWFDGSTVRISYIERSNVVQIFSTMCKSRKAGGFVDD